MKMRKRKHSKKSICPKTDVWFTITPEAIKRVEDYLNATRLTWNQGITFVPDILEGRGALAGPTKEN